MLHYFLVTCEECGGADILNVIKFIYILLEVCTFLIPVALVIMIMIDFAKNVMSGKEDEIRKNNNLAIRRIIMAVVIFLIPTIVKFTVDIVGDVGVDFMECVDMAIDGNYDSDCTIVPSTSDNSTSEETSTTRTGGSHGSSSSSSGTDSSSSEETIIIE